MLELVWYTKADDAICFQIVQYHDDYLIHSEMAISRLDKNGHAVWQFSGKDIFVSAIDEAGKEFVVGSDRIVLRDFMSNRYQINCDNELLTFMAGVHQ